MRVDSFYVCDATAALLGFLPDRLQHESVKAFREYRSRLIDVSGKKSSFRGFRGRD